MKRSRAYRFPTAAHIQGYLPLKEDICTHMDDNGKKRKQQYNTIAIFLLLKKKKEKQVGMPLPLPYRPD